MKDPKPVNLQTSAEIRKAGWQAECRDADGHLCRTHVPFGTDEEIVWLVREALEHGETVTIWPDSKIATIPPPLTLAAIEQTDRPNASEVKL